MSRSAYITARFEAIMKDVESAQRDYYAARDAEEKSRHSLRHVEGYRNSKRPRIDESRWKEMRDIKHKMLRDVQQERWHGGPKLLRDVKQPKGRRSAAVDAVNEMAAGRKARLGAHQDRLGPTENYLQQRANRYRDLHNDAVRTANQTRKPLHPSAAPGMVNDLMRAKTRRAFGTYMAEAQTQQAKATREAEARAARVVHAPPTPKAPVKTGGGGKGKLIAAGLGTTAALTAAAAYNKRRVEKSFVGNKAIPITQMTGAQRKQLATRVVNAKKRRVFQPDAAPKRLFGKPNVSSFDRAVKRTYEGEINSLKGVHPAGRVQSDKGVHPETTASIKRIHRQMGGKNRVIVTSRLSPLSGRDAEAGTIQRGKTSVVNVGRGASAAPDSLVAHELAHTLPKGRSLHRMARIQDNPQKLIREEARADATAARFTGKKTSGSMYEQESKIRNLSEGMQRVYRKIPLVGRNSAAGIAAQTEALAPNMSARQARTYRDVRRQAGAPVPNLIGR